MMKWVKWCILAALLLTAAGCGETVPETQTPSPVAEQTPAPSWTEETVCALFEGSREPGQEVVDAVVFSDFAYDRVGAVLFREEEKGSGVAVLDAQGLAQRCGFVLHPAEEPEMTYLGEGAMTFVLKEESGAAAPQKLTFSADGEGNITFRSEDISGEF